MCLVVNNLAMHVPISLKFGNGQWSRPRNESWELLAG